MDRKGLCEKGLDDSGIGEFVDGFTTPDRASSPLLNTYLIGRLFVSEYMTVDITRRPKIRVSL